MLGPSSIQTDGCETAILDPVDLDHLHRSNHHPTPPTDLPPSTGSGPPSWEGIGKSRANTAATPGLTWSNTCPERSLPQPCVAGSNPAGSATKVLVSERSVRSSPKLLTVVVTPWPRDFVAGGTVYRRETPSRAGVMGRSCHVAGGRPTAPGEAVVPDQEGGSGRAHRGARRSSRWHIRCAEPHAAARVRRAVARRPREPGPQADHVAWLPQGARHVCAAATG
jgi:hypothetical protein